VDDIQLLAVEGFHGLATEPRRKQPITAYPPLALRKTRIR
jgi:hypothetical protein